MTRLVALLLLSGCDLLFQVERVELDADGAVPRPDSALPPWSAPVALSMLNEAGAFEADTSMTADGLELYFSSDRNKAANELDIYVATRGSTTEMFGPPTLVVELTTDVPDAGSVSADGMTFYMARPGMGVLRSTRSARGVAWSTPIIVPELSKVTGAINPAISPDGLSFVVNDPAATSDLFLYSRATTDSAWEAPRQVTEVASPQADGAGCFDATGLVMVFHTEREFDASGTPLRKLYETSRPARDQPFVPRNTYAITEIGRGADPWISPDFRTLVFTRDGEIYTSTR